MAKGALGRLVKGAALSVHGILEVLDGTPLVADGRQTERATFGQHAFAEKAAMHVLSVRMRLWC